MLLENYFEHFGPYVRVATAVAPFVLAMLWRLVFGVSRATRWMITLGTAWFAVNTLLAPYTAPMRQDILDLRSWLP